MWSTVNKHNESEVVMNRETLYMHRIIILHAHYSVNVYDCTIMCLYGCTTFYLPFLGAFPCGDYSVKVA